ncbi:MAG TPA: sugar ABC transporter substrate-binding protein [Candidatus Acidoferrum sp.]|nr:sugar ABC transporter substrate-binding protein [Candidatus Acidoferrum sp.]
MLVATACGGGGSGGGGNFDASTVSGTVVLSGWQASPEEGQALQAALSGFKAKYPKVTVDYEPIAGDYPTAMVAKFSAHQPPDVFYVDSGVAPDWIKQGVLQSLDDWASSRGFDTSQFYPGYLNAFKGSDGKVYGYPKDGNTLAMAYNPDMLNAAGVQPPTTYDEMTKVGAALKAKGVVAYSMSTTLDRILAFVYGDGGALLNSNKTQDAINSKFKDAVSFYLNLFQMGYAKSPSQLGVDWSGKALGEQKAAIIFEGGWLDSYMKGSFPSVPYKWVAMPKGTAGQSTLGFTVSYSIGKDSAHKDAAWLLLTYLTGPEGMKLWTQGGVANPSRKDVPAPAGKDVLVSSASFAHPWSFIPGFSKVSDAFNNSFEAAVEGKGTVDDVVTKTKAALDQQLNQP